MLLGRAAARLWCPRDWGLSPEDQPGDGRGLGWVPRASPKDPAFWRPGSPHLARTSEHPWALCFTERTAVVSPRMVGLSEHLQCTQRGAWSCSLVPTGLPLSLQWERVVATLFSDGRWTPRTREPWLCLGQSVCPFQGLLSLISKEPITSDRNLIFCRMGHCALAMGPK